MLLGVKSVEDEELITCVSRGGNREVFPLRRREANKRINKRTDTQDVKTHKCSQRALMRCAGVRNLTNQTLSPGRLSSHAQFSLSLSSQPVVHVHVCVCVRTSDKPCGVRVPYHHPSHHPPPNRVGLGGPFKGRITSYGSSRCGTQVAR